MGALGAQGKKSETLITLSKDVASKYDWRSLPKEEQEDLIRELLEDREAAKKTEKFTIRSTSITIGKAVAEVTSIVSST